LLLQKDKPMRISLCIFFFTTYLIPLQAQINADLFSEYPLTRAVFDTSARVFPQTDKPFAYGLQASFGWQNDALTPNQNWRDKTSAALHPWLVWQVNPHLNLRLRGLIERDQTKPLYAERSYWSDTYGNYRGDVEIGIAEYTGDWLNLVFGRDYYLPGKSFGENLLFSRYCYPYDLAGFTIHNKYVRLSSTYLHLNDHRTAEGIVRRHLNTHRLEIDLGGGYLAFSDVVIYGGANRQIEPALFNPFIAFYPYQHNQVGFESNTVMSIDFYLPWREWFTAAEFVLDDFQIDKEDPNDLEPTEYAAQLTLGRKNILPGWHIRMNYTRVANRTFNAPDHVHEKYIYKNFPIGHVLGNNFWQTQATLTWQSAPVLLGELSLIHIERGAEALYSPFNKDFLNYTVEQGYEESFPFGGIRSGTGLIFRGFYNPWNWLLFGAEFSAWPQNELLPAAYNARLSLGVQY